MAENLGPNPEEMDAKGESSPEEKWTPENFESSMEMMPEILSDMLKNYSAEELKKQPIRVTDVLMIMLSSGTEVPETWIECNPDQQATIKSVMIEAAGTFSGARVEDSDEGPIITA